MLKENLYLYKIKNYKVIDGDTIEATIDLGFELYHLIRLRLMDVYAPETRGKTKEAGMKATQFLENELGKYDNLYVKTSKSPVSYLRYVGIIYGEKNQTLVNINDVMNDYLKTL